MSINHSETLLHEATTLRRAQALVGEQPGAKFNIFQVLDMESDEVYTHSLFLAELLSPHGSHDMGDIFLQLWLNLFEITGIDTKKARCEVEFFIAPRTETTGGRIDLLIHDGAPKVIIENKIYAGDQPNQLLRYYNFDPNAKIFYLTLFGSSPSEESTGRGKLSVEQYTCISYADHVLRWLEQCRKEAVHIPTLRETITQYIALIKKLTHQHFDGKMQEELVNKIFTTSDHLTSFFDLQSQGLVKAVYSKITSKWKEDLVKLAKELNMKLDPYFEQRVKWHGFSLRNADLDSLQIRIDFQFSVFPNNLSYGFSYEPTNEGMPNKPVFSLEPLQYRFRETFRGAKPSESEWWPVSVRWRDYSAEQVCTDIYFSDAFMLKVKEKVKQLLKMVEEAQPEIKRQAELLK